MKIRIGLIAVMLLTIINVGSACVCSSEEGGGDVAELMEMVPISSTDFTFWNIESIGNDFLSIWQDWTKTEEQWIESTVGIKLGEVKYYAQALIPGSGVITIITGDFNLDNLQTKLSDNGYDSETHNDIKMMITTVDEKDIAIAMYKKGILAGEKELVEKCIDVAKGKSGNPSLYEDSSIKEIVDKLTGGIMTGISKNKVLYDELEGLGVSIEKKDKTTLKVKAAYKFTVPSAAANEDTLAEIKDDLSKIDEPAIKVECSNPSTSHKGELIEASASMSLDDFSYFTLKANT